MNRLKGIKKALLSLFAVMMLQTAVVGQVQNDNRTLKTQVADLLVQFPATDEEDFNRLMLETASLGQPGILEMARMFGPQGQDDNSQLEYALGGLSFYVMQPGNEELRLIASNAYAEALNNVRGEEVKAFFIRQLQRVGKDEAVPVLEQYLADDRFCSPAARALVSINTASAQQALLDALSGSSGSCQYALIEGLADVRNKNAVEALENLVGSSDVKTKKLALYALANIGDPSSEDVLADQAEAADYKLNETNATTAYFLWAQRMVEAGNTKPVEKLTKKLIKKLDDEGQVHSRTVALKLYTDAKGEAAASRLVKAATDDNPEFRAAALKFAAPLTGEKINEQWLKQLRKADAPVKADLIAFLGDREDAANYAAVAEYLNSEDPAVKLAAIRASAKLGNEKAVPALLQIMENAGEEEIEAVKVSLLTIEGDNVASAVATALPEVNSPAGKAALIDVLAARKASRYSAPVFALIDNQDKQVRSAAINALQHVSTESNLPELYSLLVSVNDDREVTQTQAAIINALGANNARNASAIMRQMEQAPSGKEHLYYNILASIGNGEALKAVVKEYHQGNAVAKKAAIEALRNWKDFAAGRELLQIAQSSAGSPYFDQALKAYVHQVNTSENTDENKYLLYREAMEIAETPAQKRLVMRQIGNTPTLPALFYAATFLDDEDVKRDAAGAVTNIVQGNDNFYGERIRTILEKTMATLEGQESAYLKEAVRNHLESMPEGPGFVALFNGKDLTGWKGLVGNPLKRAEMDVKTLAKEQAKADEEMRESWIVEDGKLVFTGKGHNISTARKYSDFEMYVDWKIEKEGDAGIYLRGTPQVQIWDIARVKSGAQVGSGGLFNNKTHESKPLKVADNPVGEWNTFHIIMKGEKVTVYLNGELVVDNVVLENYWDRDQPIFPEDYIELQAHGTRVEYRDIYLRELTESAPFVLSEEEKAEGFEVLFDGTNLDKWIGNKSDYVIENNDLVIRPKKGSRGNLYTKDEYADFVFRFEFQLTPGANNGLGIRTPSEGNAAYQGMELQILDNTADVYKDLHKYQYHGSVYGVIPAKRGYLKPVGEWNYQEVIANGPNIKIILNGHVILDGNIKEASKNGTMDGKDHPGLLNPSGHIGFLGHGSVVKFRNIRIKDLSSKI